MQNNTCENFTTGREIVVFADKRLYSKAVILKCLYWYGSHFRTSISLGNDGMYRVTLTLSDTITEEHVDLQAFLYKFERDLVDFHLREIVLKETKNVRDLLIAKAFANIESSEEPPGQVADPVGFGSVMQD